MKRLFGLVLMLGMCAAAHAAADPRVFKLFQSQQWKEAVALSQEYSRANPKDAQAKFVYSVALMYNGDLAQARGVLNSLMGPYPRVSSAHNNLGVIYLAEGKLGDAKKEFEATLALDSRHTNARKNLALLQGASGPVAVAKANVDKRGIEFLGFPDTPAIPAVVSSQKGVAVPAVVAPAPSRTAAVETAGRKWEVPLAPGAPVAASPGVISTPKEKVAVSERENNPFNEDVKRQVFDALNVWVTAWAKQDVDKYLAMYSPDFEPGNNKTRAEWEKQRRLRIANKGQIRIDAVDVVLEVGSSTAVVATFQQHYRADVLNEISNKMLVFIRDSEKSNQWRIVDERTSY